MGKQQNDRIEVNGEGEGEPEEWRDEAGKMENLSVTPSKLNAENLFGSCPSLKLQKQS